MSCCGKKRKKFRNTALTRQRSKNPAKKSTRLRSSANSKVFFQYLGRSRLRVVGPRTGKLYQFNFPRAVIAVDPRDQFALANVSYLKKVIKAN